MSFSFGARSREALDTCRDELVVLAEEALDASPVDFSILEGLRPIERQQLLFRQGFSKLDGVNKLSKHNPTVAQPLSRAFDFAPYPLDWNDTWAFSLVAGVLLTTAKRLDISVRWGADWDRDGIVREHRFRDFGHLELLLEA